MSKVDDLLSEGLEHHRAGRLAAAQQAYVEAEKTDPENTEALNLLGILVHQTGKHEHADKLLRRAIAGAPQVAKYHGNLGTVLNALGRSDDALKSYATARELDPSDAGFPYNAATVLVSLGQTDEAVALFQTAIELRSDHLEARVNLASTLSMLGRDEEGEAEARRAVALLPEAAETHYCLAQILLVQRKHHAAAESFDASLRCDAENFSTTAGLLNARLATCDWRDYDALVEHVRNEIATDNQQTGALGAFGALSLPLKHDELAKVATMRATRLLASAKGRRNAPTVAATPRTPSKVRIGFLSNDFRDHPVGHLVSALFTVHKSGRVETYAYSTGEDDQSAYRRRVEEGADRFVDLRKEGHLSAGGVAERIVADGIDILVDLGGLVLGARPDVLALRPAPLLVAWLGFAGTTGGLHDYTLVGPDLVTPESRASFKEALVTLPHGWLIPDDSTRHSEAEYSRNDASLPEDGPVLCCFNGAHKIEPLVFALWMRILERAPDAVLWFRLGDEAFSNLRAAATHAGIDPQRLINAPRVADKVDHLARHACADLFLDTLTFNAHSTALDALWAGVPLITSPGATFQSRVTAAILRVAGLDDLVVEDISAYEELAVALCASPSLLADVKTRLDSGLEGPAFQTLPFVRSLENAFTEMWRRHAAGIKPTDFEAPVYE